MKGGHTHNHFYNVCSKHVCRSKEHRKRRFKERILQTNANFKNAFEEQTMSMTIFSKADPSINVSFAYSRFFDLRLQIAKSINYELGRIYENSRPPATAKTAEACKQWDCLFQIVNKRSQALMIFLETPDYEGKATAATCKKLMQYKSDFDSPEYTEWYKENILKPFWAVIKSGTIKGIVWH